MQQNILEIATIDQADILTSFIAFIPFPKYEWVKPRFSIKTPVHSGGSVGDSHPIPSSSVLLRTLIATICFCCCHYNPFEKFCQYPFLQKNFHNKKTESKKITKSFRLRIFLLCKTLHHQLIHNTTVCLPFHLRHQGFHNLSFGHGRKGRFQTEIRHHLIN